MNFFTRPAGKIILGILCGMMIVPGYGKTPSRTKKASRTQTASRQKTASPQKTAAVAITLEEIRKKSDAKVEQLKEVIRKSLQENPGDRQKVFQEAAKIVQLKPVKNKAYQTCMIRMKREQRAAYPLSDAQVQQKFRKKAYELYPVEQETLQDGNSGDLYARAAKASASQRNTYQVNQYVRNEFKKYQQEKAAGLKKIYKDFEPELMSDMGYLYRYERWLSGQKMVRTILYHTDKLEESAAEVRKMSDYPKIAEFLQSAMKQYPDGLNIAMTQQLMHDKKVSYDTASLQTAMDRAQSMSDYPEIAKIIQPAIRQYSDATNIQQAQQLLRDKKVSYDTASLQTAMLQAQKAGKNPETVAFIADAIRKYPDGTNQPSAKELWKDIKTASDTALLAVEIRKAQQAGASLASFRALAAAIQKYDFAANIPDARNLHKQYRSSAEAEMRKIVQPVLAELQASSDIPYQFETLQKIMNQFPDYPDYAALQNLYFQIRQEYNVHVNIIGELKKAQATTDLIKAIKITEAVVKAYPKHPTSKIAMEMYESYYSLYRQYPNGMLCPWCRGRGRWTNGESVGAFRGFHVTCNVCGGSGRGYFKRQGN